MRSCFVILVSLYGAFAFADQQPVLTCDTSVQLQGPKKDLSIKIFQDGANYTARVNDVNGPEELPVEVTEAGVREGLSPEMTDQNLNIAEQLVAFAMAIEAEPDTKAIMTSGVDLKAVRSAKVYDIEPKANNLGKGAIVDAKDANGKSLGKFLSGLLLGPCK